MNNYELTQWLKGIVNSKEEYDMLEVESDE